MSSIPIKKTTTNRALLNSWLTSMIALSVACQGSTYSLGYPDDSVRDGGSNGSSGRTTGGSLGSTGAGTSTGSGPFDAGGPLGTSSGGTTGSGTTGSGTTGADTRAPRCGDGLTDPPEECDDGNVSPGDGCSASCRFEVQMLATSNYSTCVMSSGGAVKCWGYNGDGQLGLGDTEVRGDQSGEMGDNLPAVSLGTGRRALSIAVGGVHACALLDDGSVKCWGYNGNGELGLGDATNRGDQPGEMGDNLPTVSLGTGRRATRIAAGVSHTCALLDDGSLKCWGYNIVGQLGLGDDTNRGDQPGEMGDDLPAVSLGAGRHAISVVAGSAHTCALLDDGSLKCWGSNNFGELGLGDTQPRGWVSDEMGDKLPAVDLGTGRPAMSIGAGHANSCALLDDGTVKCWGYNMSGGLGLGDTIEHGAETTDMGDNLPAVSLGTGRRAKSISVNGYTNCALLDDDSLKCWGGNTLGELGLGDTLERGAQPGEMGDDLPVVGLGTGRHATSIATGHVHTCALLDDGSVKCWGGNSVGSSPTANAVGELGLGDTEDRGDQPGEMGDNLPAVDVGF